MNTKNWIRLFTLLFLMTTIPTLTMLRTSLAKLNNNIISKSSYSRSYKPNTLNNIITNFDHKIAKLEQSIFTLETNQKKQAILNKKNKRKITDLKKQQPK